VTSKKFQSIATRDGEPLPLGTPGKSIIISQNKNQFDALLTND
jgi:hypothetical protein